MDTLLNILTNYIYLLIFGGAGLFVFMSQIIWDYLVPEKRPCPLYYPSRMVVMALSLLSLGGGITCLLQSSL